MPGNNGEPFRLAHQYVHPPTPALLPPPPPPGREDCGTDQAREIQWGYLCYDCEEAVHLDLHTDRRESELREEGRWPL